MNPDDFKNFNLPHTNAEERENARVVQALSGPDTSRWPWYANVIVGIGIGGLAAFSYYDITAAEQGGRDLWLPKFIAIFYHLFGKWGVVGFFTATSLFCIGTGIWSAVTPDDQSPPTKS